MRCSKHFLACPLLAVCLAAVPARADDFIPTKAPRKLLEERAQSALKVFQLKHQRLVNANASPEEATQVLEWSRRSLEARLAFQAAVAPDDLKTRIQSYQDHLDQVRDIEKYCDGLAKKGQGLQSDAEAARYFRIQAEILLLEAGGKLPEQKDQRKEIEKP